MPCSAILEANALISPKSGKAIIGEATAMNDMLVEADRIKEMENQKKQEKAKQKSIIERVRQEALDDELRELHELEHHGQQHAGQQPHGSLKGDDTNQAAGSDPGHHQDVDEQSRAEKCKS